MTPEQLKYVQPVDPTSRWRLLQTGREQAAHYVSRFIKFPKSTQNPKNVWFPTQKALKITRFYRNESYWNYKHCNTWRLLTHKK